MTDTQPHRTIYFDYLRVFATLAVIILHLCAQNWYVTDVNGLQWQTFNFFDSVVRWGVPVFVMISGSLFLGREISLSRIYSKYILRMVIAFIVWSAVYALFVDGSKTERMLAAIQGHYHMWYVLMIIGIYACIPFIRPIARNETRTKYYLALAFTFGFLLPELSILAEDFGTELINKGMGALNKDLSNMNMYIVLGYASYFVLGYYLNKITLSKKQRMIIYILGLAGFAATIVLDLAVALKTQTYCGHYYGNFTINVLFEAVAVFTWFKYKDYKHGKWNAFIQKLSKYSFGAYLVHALVIEQFNRTLGLNTLSFHPVFAVLSLALIVFTISFTISAVLNRIPVLKKYIV